MGQDWRIPEPKLFSLGSGIRLWVERQPAALSSAFGLFAGVGSSHEGPGEAGLAHLLEHILFKGSTRLSADEISWNIERFGGDLNAYTDRELICFHAWMPRDKWDVAASLVFEMIFDARLDGDEFEKEREVVIQELRGIEESAEEEFWEALLEKTWPRHPLGRRIGAKSEDVKKLKFKTALEFFKKKFLQAPLTLVVVSPIEEKKVFERIKSLFKESQNNLWHETLVKGSKKRNRKHKPKRKLPILSNQSWVQKYESDQVHLGFSFPGLPLAHRQETALSSLCTLLGGGSSSRLFRELRENHGLTYSAGAYHASFQEGGVVQGYFSTEKSKLFEACKLAGQVCRDIAHKLEVRDLEFLRSLLEGSLYMNYEGVVNRMESIGRQDILLGAPMSLKESFDELKTLEDESLRELAVRFGQKPHIFALGPLVSKDLKKIEQAWMGTLK